MLAQLGAVMQSSRPVLVLTLDGLQDLKNCNLKTKKVLRPFFRPKKS